MLVSSRREPHTSRRHMLRTIGAAAPALLGLHETSFARSEHFVQGGIGGVQRGEFGFDSEVHDGGYAIIRLPAASRVYMIPMTVLNFDESGGARYLMEEGLVSVLRDGLYQISANLDWPAQPRSAGQDGYDVNLRKILIKRVPVGVVPPKYTPGEVTEIPPNSEGYDTIAAHDTPGSSAPRTIRTSLRWAPGEIQPGAVSYIDVTLPSGRFIPTVADVVQASHRSLSDAALGPANIGIVVTARMVSTQKVRVVVENRYNTVPVRVPEDQLNILVQSSVASSGNNADAWCYLNSGTVMLLAGERLMLAVRSESLDDYLQASTASFLRIANVVPGDVVSPSRKRVVAG